MTLVAEEVHQGSDGVDIADRAESDAARAYELFDAGDPAAAPTLLEAVAAEDRRVGRYGREGAERLHVEAQARAAVHGAEAARPWLLRARAEAPEHWRAAGTRAALAR